eukprot:2012474-Prorocentrum_lima.AAC.1
MDTVIESHERRVARRSNAGGSSRPSPPPTEIDYNPLQPVSSSEYQCGSCSQEPSPQYLTAFDRDTDTESDDAAAII